MIIPTLNEGNFLGSALTSLLKAGVAMKHVYVSDGGSNDNTVKVAREFGVQLLRSATGRGPQLNSGGWKAVEDGAEILLFVHADSRVPVNLTEAIEKVFLDPNTGYACFRSQIGSDRRVYRTFEKWIDRRTAWSGIPYGELGLAVRPGLFSWLGGYPDWPLFEEIRLAGKLKKISNFRRIEVPLWTSARRWEEGGAWLVTLRNWVMMALYLAGVAPKTLAKFYSFSKSGARKVM